MGWRRWIVPAAGLLAAGLLALAPLRAASVLPDTDAALVPGAEPVASPAQAGEAPETPARPGAAEPGPGLAPDLVRSELDLLLDLQGDTAELGALPSDGPAASELAGAVDLRMLSPDLPANPRFPGVGLPFELPGAPSRFRLDDAGPGAPVEPAPRPWSSTAASWLAREGDGRVPEPITELRAWVATHRTALLVGLGVAALLLAGFAAVTRPSARGQAEGDRRRRRRREHPSDFDHSSGLARAGGSRRRRDAPSTLPPVADSAGAAPRRRRRRSTGVDPATHRR